MAVAAMVAVEETVAVAAVAVTVMAVEAATVVAAATDVADTRPLTLK